MLISQRIALSSIKSINVLCQPSVINLLLYPLVIRLLSHLPIIFVTVRFDCLENHDQIVITCNVSHDDSVSNDSVWPPYENSPVFVCFKGG